MRLVFQPEALHEEIDSGVDMLHPSRQGRLLLLHSRLGQQVQDAVRDQQQGELLREGDLMGGELCIVEQPDGSAAIFQRLRRPSVVQDGVRELAGGAAGQGVLFAVNDPVEHGCVVVQALLSQVAVEPLEGAGGVQYGDVPIVPQALPVLGHQGLEHHGDECRGDAVARHVGNVEAQVACVDGKVVYEIAREVHGGIEPAGKGYVPEAAVVLRQELELDPAPRLFVGLELPVQGLQVLAILPVAAHQGGPLQGPPHRALQHTHVLDGLDDIVPGPALERLHRVANLADTGDDDHRCLRGLAGQRLQDVEPIHPGQPEVAEHHVRLLAPEGLDP